MQLLGSVIRKPFGYQLLIKKTLKACGNNFWPKSSIICEKVSKSFIFIVKVFWATFLIDRHWATFYTIQLVTLPLTQTLCVPQYEQCERIFIKRISITDWVRIHGSNGALMRFGLRYKIGYFHILNDFIEACSTQEFA